MKTTQYVARQPDDNGFIHYPETEHQVWNTLITRQLKVIEGRACQEYLDGIEQLGLPHDRIPQLVSAGTRATHAPGPARAAVPAQTGGLTRIAATAADPAAALYYGGRVRPVRRSHMRQPRTPTMTALTQAHCEACRADAPHVSDEELPVLLRQIPDWNIEVRDGIMQLEKVYLFKNFKHALAFTNAVGEISEAEGHHPGLLTEWGKVTVTWWSHSIKGLHRNDFIMAARTDEVAKTAEGRK